MLKFNNLKSRLTTILGLLVILIIILIGTTNYISVRRALLKDIRQKQLPSFVEASQSTLQSILERAIETSYQLANDPAINQWFASGEESSALKQLATQRLDQLIGDEYFNSFAINIKTGHHWTNGGKSINTISTKNASDQWFYNHLKSNSTFALNFDYDVNLSQTFLFVNITMGKKDNPLGIAGVGLKPDKMVEELTKKKITKNSLLWLIDGNGKILLSQDTAQINKNISEFLTDTQTSTILGNDNGVIENQDYKGSKFEVAYTNVGQTGYSMVVIAPTGELVALLTPIRNNTFIFSIIFLIITLLIVQKLSSSIANPLTDLTKVALGFSKGDLSIDIKDDLTHRSDEIGRLADAFNTMKNQIIGVVSKVKTSAELISNGSTELNKSALSLSESAMEQASSTEEVSA